MGIPRRRIEQAGEIRPTEPQLPPEVAEAHRAALAAWYEALAQHNCVIAGPGILVRELASDQVDRLADLVETALELIESEHRRAVEIVLQRIRTRKKLGISGQIHHALDLEDLREALCVIRARLAGMRGEDDAWTSGPKSPNSDLP